MSVLSPDSWLSVLVTLTLIFSLPVCFSFSEMIVTLTFPPGEDTVSSHIGSLWVSLIFVFLFLIGFLVVPFLFWGSFSIPVVSLVLFFFLGDGFSSSSPSYGLLLFIGNLTIVVGESSSWTGASTIFILTSDPSLSALSTLSGSLSSSSSSDVNRSLVSFSFFSFFSSSSSSSL